MAGHATVAGRRPNGYEREITLTGQYGPLHLRGRADGYDAARNQLEEIKTHRGDLSRQPENHRHLHSAQARIYGWLLCQQRGLEELNVALVYFDIVSQKETVLSERHTAAELEAFFNEQCAAFLAWAEQELVHRRTRDAALAQLGFAHAQFRPGQRDLAEAVFKAASTGRCLLAQAPTGIGKTLGTLFPLLKRARRKGWIKCFIWRRARRGGNWRWMPCARSKRSRYARWNWWRVIKPAFTPIAPAMAVLVRWRRAFTIACPPPALMRCNRG